MLQNKPRILIIDDFSVRGWVLKRILNSKGYCANSLTYTQNAIDGIKWKTADLLILDLDFSEPSIIRILKKIKERNPSLPIFICSNSVTERFKNQAIKLGASVFLSKGEVEQILGEIKKLSLNNKERDLASLDLKRRERREVKKDGSRKEYRIFQFSGSN